MERTLIVNPEFESLIPKLTNEEFKMLEENILSEGCILVPIVVWNDIIVDGHNRYKIAREHPNIVFSIYQKDFDNKYEAISWICANQLGRRSITEERRDYLLGKRYLAEKQMHGGDRKSEAKKSSGQNGHLILQANTRERIAEETNVPPSRVKRAAVYTQGVDFAEEEVPGLREELLSGRLKHNKKDVYAIFHAPKRERRAIIDWLLSSKDERSETYKNHLCLKPDIREEKNRCLNALSKDYLDFQQNGKESDANAVNQRPVSNIPPIEESILESMMGAVNVFIDNINDYLSRFPKLRTDPIYSRQTKQILNELKKYLNDVKGELQ